MDYCDSITDNLLNDLRLPDTFRRLSIKFTSCTRAGVDNLKANNPWIKVVFEESKMDYSEAKIDEVKRWWLALNDD